MWKPSTMMAEMLVGLMGDEVILALVLIDWWAHVEDEYPT